MLVETRDWQAHLLGFFTATDKFSDRIQRNISLDSPIS